MRPVPSFFLLTLLLTTTPGCVVRYEGKSPSDDVAVTRDLAGAEGRALLVGRSTTDPRQKQRVEAARQLMVAARTWPLEQRSEVVDFVNSLLDIEESEMPVALGLMPPNVDVTNETVDPPGSSDGVVAEPVNEVSLDNGEPIGTNPGNPPTEPVGVGPTPEDVAAREADILYKARLALAENRPRDAISILDGLQDLSRVEGAEALRKEAVDSWVAEERERAAQLFLSARDIQDPAAKKAALEEVLGVLQGLMFSYPDNSYNEAIQRNLKKVEAELP